MKITTWNVENLFILMDKYQNQDLKNISNEEWESLSSSLSVKNKHLGKIEELSKIIDEINSDIIFLQEVGGKESLLNFNKYFLDNKYKCYINDGNSTRGIAVGFLVSKSSNLKIKFKTNKNMRLENGRRISRDFPQLEVYDKKENLILVLINVHLKSQISSDDDFKGMKQREMEIKLLNKFSKDIENEKKVPVIIAGDFNVDLNHGDERYDLKENFIDFHDLKKSEIQDRYTHAFFGQKRILNQLDYILISKKYKNKIILNKSYNYEFKTEYGDKLGIPDNMFERNLQPSDHRPIILSLKL